MFKKVLYFAFALLLTFMLLGTPVGHAQYSLAVTDTITSNVTNVAQDVNTDDNDDDNNWGWIGLIGLAGLFGLRRRDRK